jgi:hypothetical protein
VPLEHLPAPAAIQADDIIAMNGSPDRHRGVRSLPVSGADSISSSEAMKNGRGIRASNTRPAMSRCGRRRRQRCALMKAKQRVPALRGGRPDGLAWNRGGCDRISLRRASMRRTIMPNSLGSLGNVGL